MAWFDTQAKEAVKLYTSIFVDESIAPNEKNNRHQDINGRV
ncbi:VOC family protein [Cohnella sp. REN36]|nr:VOC family protein [Cohnella sp. REN36]